MKREDFEPLALEHLEAVYRLAFHLTQSVDEAEELVQEVYVRAFRPTSMAGYDPSRNAMKSWLFAICHNAYFTESSRRRRDHMVLPDIDTVATETAEPSEVMTAWNRPNIDWDRTDGDLRALIDELRPEYREVLLLWGVEGMKYREIGEVLGVPLGTVMSRLYRARSILVRRLEEMRRAQDQTNRSGDIIRRIGGSSALIGLVCLPWLVVSALEKLS